MFNLYDDPPSKVKFKNLEINLDLAFDNVLRAYDILKDDSKSEMYRVEASLVLLTDLNPNDVVNMDRQLKFELFLYIFDDFVTKQKPMMLPPSEAGKKEKELYSFSEDADYIWASFFLLGVDLDKLRGKLHWWKFQALVAALPDNSKFKQVLQIRDWKPDKNDSKKHIREMTKLQMMYALHTTQEDVEFMALDLAGKDQYLKDHPDYAKKMKGDE